MHHIHSAIKNAIKQIFPIKPISAIQPFPILTRLSQTLCSRPFPITPITAVPPCPILTQLITRNFGEKMLTGAVFLDVAKTFDTVWIDCLLYKLTLLNFPSYMVHSISSYLRGRTFEASFQTATSSRQGMRAGVPQCGLISPVHFSHYVNDIPPPSHHVELALFADDTAIIATSRKPKLLVSYLESYLNDLQR